MLGGVAILWGWVSFGSEWLWEGMGWDGMGSIAWDLVDAKTETRDQRKGKNNCIPVRGWELTCGVEALVIIGSRKGS